MFGFAMVVVMARGERLRIPVALGLIAPQRRGHQHRLFRHRLQACVPPGWGQPVVVVAAAGCAAHATRRLMTEQPSTSGCARPRTRPFPDGQSRRDLVQPLPKRCDARRASDHPDGHRHDSWVVVRRATLHTLGDVPLVRAKKRRHEGPKSGTILVTKRTEASAGTILSMDAWRWGVEISPPHDGSRARLALAAA